VSQEPNDRALYIEYRGRSWVVIFSNGNYSAVPENNDPVKPSELKKLYKYLKDENFIGDNGEPMEPVMQ
jgi:hypothetical protein